MAQSSDPSQSAPMSGLMGGIMRAASQYMGGQQQGGNPYLGQGQQMPPRQPPQGGNPYMGPQGGGMGPLQGANPYTNPQGGQYLQQGAYGRQAQVPQYQFGQNSGQGFAGRPMNIQQQQFNNSIPIGTVRGQPVQPGSMAAQQMSQQYQARGGDANWHRAPSAGNANPITAYRSNAYGAQQANGDTNFGANGGPPVDYYGRNIG